MKLKAILQLVFPLLLSFAAAACSLPRAEQAEPAKAAAPRSFNYLPPERFAALPFQPPPEAASEGQAADLAAVLAWQEKRTRADCERAAAASSLSFDSFWGAESPFGPAQEGEVKEFFGLVASDLGKAVTAVKDRWRRPRPYEAYPGLVNPCIGRSSGPSYPSGHAAFARVFALVLADIAPEKKGAFFAKAGEIAESRVISGVHYPTDVAAGVSFGEIYHAELLKSGDYLTGIERMKALRACGSAP
ncbi:MAG: phosphatase PAP2 family protein [Elusimicrobiales bacterium]|nr:phosphatase PAP2 family protein [Elusimicrobiales bacterium]